MNTTKKLEEDLFENIIVTLTFGTGMAALVSPMNNFLVNYEFTMNSGHVYMLIISFLSSIISNSLGTIRLLKHLYIKKFFHYNLLDIIKRVFVSIKLVLAILLSNFWKGICSILDIISFTSIFIPTMDFLKNTTSYGNISNMVPVVICIIMFVMSYYLKKCILLFIK